MMEFVRATEQDISALIERRTDYISADFGTISPETEDRIRNSLPGYFARHLDRDLFVFTARENGVIVSTAMLLVVEKPCNPDFINGKVGEVLNVYTMPEYRRRGIARRLIEQLMEFARKQNLDFIALSATEDGYPMYKQLGFAEHHSKYTEMRYKI